MDAYIQQNALLVYALVMVAAALLHWGQKVRKGEATANFMTYWFTETPGYSLGTLGALVGAWWLVYTTNGLDKMASHMVIEGAFATGWAINSAVSQGFVAEMRTAGDKVAGFVRLGLLPWLVAGATVCLLLQGCPAMMPRAEAPKTVPEGIEAAAILIGKLSDGLVDMTCGQYQDGSCIEPGRPLDPVDALVWHGKLERAQDALVAASGITAGSVGTCLGEQRTQLACLAAVNALLIEVDRAMMVKKKGGKP